MKTILCYGDSNTWGHPPFRSLAEIGPRFGFTERWPGVLRQTLGADYWIIEEGLSGRTTAFDDPIEGTHKNGKTYLLPCLETHAPIDLVTIMLGTNDLKTRFSAPAYDIGWGIQNLASMILNSAFGPNGSAPKVLIMSPARIGKLSSLAELFIGAESKAELLPMHYRNVAETLGCSFFDAASVVTTSDMDGIHFDISEHQKLGKAVAEKILQILA